jgi:hypothetical protein
VPRNVYPVGRLDEDSEGLLILTNDKKLNHRLLDPAFAHEREYWVQVEGAITNEAVMLMQQGLQLNIKGTMHQTKSSVIHIFNERLMLVNVSHGALPYICSNIMDKNYFERREEQAGKKNDSAGWISDASLDTLSYRRN